MLPTKGYFQDIECPFYNTNCGRPYCHFRHKKRPNEPAEDGIQDPSKNAVPTYKPTPKSELENIHNSRSHIPISYVPDLAFKRDRTVRPVRIQTATYKPTPLSILSSAAKPESSLSEKNLYNPLESDINFEELTNEFDLIDNIIHDTEEAPEALNQYKANIKKEQDNLNLQLKVSKVVDDPRFSSDEEKVEVCSSKPEKSRIKLESETKKEKPDSTTSCLPEKSDNSTSEKSSKKIKKEDVKSSSKKSKSKETDSKSSSHHKSSKRESHRKEEKKGSSKDKHSSSSRHKHKSKSPKPEKHHKHKSSSDSLSVSSRDSTPDKSTKDTSKTSAKNVKESSSKSKNKSSSNSHDKKRKRSTSPSGETKEHERSDKKKREDREKSKNKSRSKEKLADQNKDKLRKHEKRHSKKTDKRKKETSESNTSTSGRDNDQEDIQDTFALDPELSDIDLNFDDEDETMRECYKIFNEYKPEPIKPQLKIEECPKTEPEEDASGYQGKKRKAHAGAETIATHSKYVPTIAPPKPVLLPGQILANRYKIAKMAQANQEQDHIMNEIKSITEKKPTSLLEAARLHKLKRLQQQKLAQQTKTTGNVVDDILNGIHSPSSSQPKVVPKKIAAVPNVALIEKAKERISLVKSRNIQNCKTVAHTQKGGRVAHIPEYNLSDIPDVLQADKSKLPVNVRTRFLTMIADECSKLYALKEDAFNRALNEEFACYEKCKVLATYRNSAMLAVNRLRKEIQERESKGLGPLLNGESAASKKESDFEGKTFYENVKKWVLTDEELDIHGYPKESGTRGKAIINNRTEINHTQFDDNYRKCCRCGKLHQVDDDGWPLFEEECLYHPLKKRTLRGEQIYLCCKSNDDTGCATSDTHVFDGTESHLLEGFQTTLPPETDSDPRSSQVYALDCEMCYTTRGLELTRVTVIDINCKTVYESLVKPLNPIMDYNTRFSGITKEQMDRTSTSILQVQANILHLCNSETILVGHSLESDMKALKIVHGNVIDTAVLFPHKMGLPHKRALRALASEYLKKIIQNDVSGHDSAEDAVTCMELIKWKLKEDLKVKTK